MGILSGKRILITGMLSNRSIAFGIATACRRQGAELAFTYADERVAARVRELAADFSSELVFPCDVASDTQIDAALASLRAHWSQLDGLVHAIGYAPREALSGGFLDGLSRDSFRIAHDISAYSFPALASAALPMLAPRAVLLTLSYLGAQRTLPHYNVMGLAKASLEASVRYLAAALGGRGVRVNAISAGPLRTLAAAGIRDFGKILEHVANTAALRRNIDSEEVGNVAAFLLSDLASGMTGQVSYVDAGYRCMAAPLDLAD
ncbi:SDR family oxidoreductase (plasmid) [Cupriavidus necator H16]|uniref:Enoyl-[acyl-carrier-protein] reductase [NADH] n=1 Tax=Cupriavidus necator (strain ATCC 17699 / DSM 428 / KCTC 22496 / NCIMB 10442 / H16 / Stanier 337) TaxID=381666 RepID=Q7WX81_CUPNH|nr:SDR family oxidoreductase [Cupriavidus necator]AAP86010.1 putative enoyl-(ACP) reductase [Cupriavidus necator H16]QCC05489.1 SDR family oxidoreductase [Cupriavidus necator H16]QQB81312.1 SDR family oxidoreductase [Cupriavidus necator]